jgi:hypothetical protein
MWPGCETVGAVGALGEPRDRFAVRVIDDGLASRKVADRALRCIHERRCAGIILEQPDTCREGTYDF